MAISTHSDKNLGFGVIQKINQHKAEVMFQDNIYLKKNQSYKFIVDPCDNNKSIEKGILDVMDVTSPLSQILFDFMKPSSPIELDGPVEFYNGEFCFLV